MPTYPDDGLEGFQFPTDEDVRNSLASPAPVAPPADMPAVAATAPAYPDEFPAASVPAEPPKSSDLVRQYLESKFKIGKNGIDPQLEQARREEALERFTKNVGSAWGGVGDTFVKGAQSFANAIAGKGFTPSAGGTGLEIAPYDAKDSPVQRYLAAKRAEQEGAKMNAEEIGSAVKAGKYLDGSDPESMEGRKLALAEKEADRRLEQGDRGLDIKQGGLDLGGQRFEETADYHAKLLALRKAGLTESQAKDQLARQKYALQEKRFGLAKEKLTNDEGQGTVPLAESADQYLKPAVAESLNDRAQSAMSVLGTIDKIRKLERDHRMGLIAPTDAAATAQTLIAELGPQWNAAQTKLAFSGPRGQAIAHALTDPTSVNGLVKDILSGGTYTKTNLDTAEQLIQESLHNQGEARGVHFPSDFGPHSKSRKPKVGTAAAGRPGSGTGPGELSDADKKALAWAQAHKDDPDAKTILKHLGAE